MSPESSGLTRHKEAIGWESPALLPSDDEIVRLRAEVRGLRKEVKGLRAENRELRDECTQLRAVHAESQQRLVSRETWPQRKSPGNCNVLHRDHFALLVFLMSLTALN